MPWMFHEDKINQIMCYSEKHKREVRAIFKASRGV